MFRLCDARSALRVLVVVAATVLAVRAATAGTPERDKDWDALVAEARKHGGAETPYKDSVSLVFQKLNGMYISITWMTDNRVRAVCVISKDENANVCGNWDTGKIAYGWRTDANSPWTHSDRTPTEQGDKGLWGSLLSGFADILSWGSKTTRRR